MRRRTERECCDGKMLEKEKRREEEEDPSLVSRANSIFDCLASRHSRLRQGSKIDYSSITLRLVPSSTPSSPGPTCIVLLPRLCFHHSNFHISSLSSLRVHLDPSRPGPSSPLLFSLHLLQGSSSSLLFRSSVIASRSRGLSASRGVP